LRGQFGSHYDVRMPNRVESPHSRIAELMLEHRDLDLVIESLSELPVRDEVQLRRLKKRKLQIKDTISLLQIQLTPDIPA
jgi:hypothetical protein